MFLLRLSGWFLFSCLVMSFTEHQLHQRFMHRRNFLSERSKGWKRTFEAHAVFHHGHYSQIFTDEPVPAGEDKEIRLTVRKAPIKALPLAAIIALVSWPCAIVFIGVVTMHHWIWNQIHLEMHKPESKSFSNWPMYLFLARHHYLHHRYPARNFNVVFPFADYVLNTNVKANRADLRALSKQGLFGKRRRLRPALRVHKDHGVMAARANAYVRNQ